VENLSMEPRWIDQPTAPSSLPHLALLRVPPGNGLYGVLTSPKPIGVQTHYMGRRTLPCVSEACPGCLARLATRDEWYTGLWTGSPSKHVIAALTPAVAWELTDKLQPRLNFRGIKVHLTRAGKAANSRLLLTLPDPENLFTSIPDEPDLRAHLLHIWGFDQGELTRDGADYADRVRKAFKSNGSNADAH